MIKIIIADDEVILRETMASYLSLEEDFKIIGQAANGVAAVKLYDHYNPDVMLLDLDMPDLDGMGAAEQILSDGHAKVIILTRHARPGLLKRALLLGVTGFVTKSTPGDVLSRVIREIYHGGLYVDPAVARSALTEKPSPLTAKELDILKAGTDGRPVDAIAAELFLAPGTVRNAISSAIKKLGVTNRATAIRKAREEGWI